MELNQVQGLLCLGVYSVAYFSLSWCKHKGENSIGPAAHRIVEIEVSRKELSLNQNGLLTPAAVPQGL